MISFDNTPSNSYNFGVRQEALEYGLQKTISRRKALGLLGLTTLALLEACRNSSKKAVIESSTPAPIYDPECPKIGDNQISISTSPQDYETPSQVEVRQDQILTEKDLEKLNVKVFNFSHFPGKIKFTAALIPLIKPIERKGARLRIVFVDGTPNEEELSKSPLNNLANFSDKEIEKHKNDINKDRPDDTTLVEKEPDSLPLALPTEINGFEILNCPVITYKVTIVDNGADSGGLASVNYSAEPLILTILVALKSPTAGYDKLQTNNYRTVPVDGEQGSSILKGFVHEVEHVNDFAGYYTGFDDPKYKADFDESFSHDERPGEKRAIEFAAARVREIQNGALPPIIIYDDKGKIL